MAENETTYVKHVNLQERKVSSKKGDFEIIKFSGKVKEFVKFLKEVENEKGYFNFEIVRRKEVGQFGDTHYMKVNDYKKDK